MDVQLARTTGPLERLAYSLAEAEAASGISRSSLYNLIAAGKLKTIQLGRRRLVPREELERLCSLNPTNQEERLA
jgi:excisionase family DNA binding protein